MAAAERSTVVGVFADGRQAEEAVRELQSSGFGPDQIGVVMREVKIDGGVTIKADVRAEQGAATGAVTGGILGGLLGAAVVLVMPGIGPVLALGVLAGVLGGSTIGIATGGLIGALIGLGLSEEEAQYCDREIQAGRTLVAVRTDGRHADAFAILRRHGAQNIDRTQAGAGQAT